MAALPDTVVMTSEARRVLPEEVPVKDLVFHVGHAASLVYAMEHGDLPLIGRSV